MLYYLYMYIMPDVFVLLLLHPGNFEQDVSLVLLKISYC